MLTTHIDFAIYKDAKKKWRAYFKSNPKLFKGVNSFLDFIESYTNIRLYNVKEDIETLNLINELFQGIGDNVKKPKKISVSLASRIDKHIIKSPYQFFFVESDYPLSDKYKNAIVGTTNDYVEIFSKCNQNSQIRLGTENAKNRFVSWEDVLPDIPVTEIIINDNYLFKKTDDSIPEQNAFKLLETIGEKYKQLKRVLIISYFDFESIASLNCIKSEGGKYNYIECSERLRKIIEDCFLENTEVILIGNQEEHDRHIFSNYFYLETPSLNNIFDLNGNLIYKKSGSLSLHSYLSPNNFENASDILKNFKINISKYNKNNRNYHSALLDGID